VKALLVALLAALMLRTGHRAGGRWWLPAVCVALAVLVMGPRLTLQPVVVSYLLLGVTLWLLVSGRRGAEEGASPGGRWWLVPGVCLLWVNLDSWFLLGPATVALFLVGELLQRQLEPDQDTLPPARLRALGVVLGVSVAACVVSPHHFRAFMLPPALGLGG